MRSTCFQRGCKGSWNKKASVITSTSTSTSAEPCHGFAFGNWNVDLGLYYGHGSYGSAQRNKKKADHSCEANKAS